MLIKNIIYIIIINMDFGNCCKSIYIKSAEQIISSASDYEYIENRNTQHKKTKCRCCNSQPYIKENNSSQKNDRDNLLLKFADRTNELLCKLHNIDLDDSILNIPIPRLVVIGSQSSGKSTAINKLMNFDLLPTGGSMVTKIPTHIRLHNVGIEDNQYATISVLKCGVVSVEYSLELNKNLSEFSSQIENITSRLITNQYNVSKTPIFIDVYSFKVENISFVDLPGIVTIARTDQGQSETIMEDIKTLIIDQVSRPNTIALVVVKANSDLETDIGLATIKTLQKEYPNITTIGVLTKPDLMDEKFRLDEIVAGRTSKSVSLDKGYFVMNNKPPEGKTEKMWFNDNFSKSSHLIKNNRYGSIHLRHFVHACLVSTIKESIPMVKEKLLTLKKNITTKNPYVSNSFKTDGEKKAFIRNLVLTLEKDMIAAINATGHVNNIGNKIKQIFVDFVNNTNNVKPFSIDVASDEYLQLVINSFGTYELSSKITFIQILEKCISDVSRRPVMQLLPHIKTCIDDIKNNMIDLGLKIMDDSTNEVPVFSVELGTGLEIDNFNTHRKMYKQLLLYPDLKHYVIDNIEKMLLTFEYRTKNAINTNLQIQEKFIWMQQYEINQLLVVEESPNTPSFTIDNDFSSVPSMNNSTSSELLSEKHIKTQHLTRTMSDSSEEELIKLQEKKLNPTIKSLTNKKRISLQNTSDNILINPNFTNNTISTDKKRKLSQHINKHNSMAFKSPLCNKNKDTLSKLITSDITPEDVRYLLSTYFKKIISIVQDNVLKTIVLVIIKNFESTFQTEMNTIIEELTDEELSKLFFEDKNTAKVKDIIKDNLDIISGLVKEIETLNY
jgi:hypothetical protein